MLRTLGNLLTFLGIVLFCCFELLQSPVGYIALVLFTALSSNEHPSCPISFVAPRVFLEYMPRNGLSGL